jgi:hypothetical protein
MRPQSVFSRPGQVNSACPSALFPLGEKGAPLYDGAMLRSSLNTVAAPIDGRQSETARLVARGTSRFLALLGFSCVEELPLPSGGRADLVAMNARGEMWIVEIKSSREDLRTDKKWESYRAHCDRLFFAFPSELPCDLFPPETGLIVADGFGAYLHCEAPEHRLPPATRKVMMIRFGLAAARRMSRLIDPQGHGLIDE